MRSFFCELYLITDLHLIQDSDMGWSKRFISLRSCVGFFHFWFRFFFVKVFDSVSLLFSKQHGLFNFKTSQFLPKIIQKDTQVFSPRPLMFKLQQEEVLKFNICVSWSSPKTNLQTNFLNLKNWSFENVVT